MDYQNSPKTTRKRKAFFLRKMFLIAISFLFIGISDSLMAQVTYYSQGNLNPAALASWNTLRTGGGAAPANFTSGDIFVVQGTGGGLGAPHSMNVTGNWNITPNNTTGRVIIESGATLSLTTANVTTPAVQVEGTLNINAGRTFTLTNGSSVPDLLVNATGVINNSNNFTMNAGTTGSVSGIYYHNVNGGTIPNVGMTWNAGSLCEITGVTTTVPAGINQNFAHFTWNCATQSANITATLNANIQGNLSIQQTNGFDFILNNNINLNNNNLTIGANGILSCLNNLITIGTGTATVNGTIRTTNANGFYGAANTTIVNSPTIFLNAGSTIDYNANGAQNISATLTYSNLSTSIGGVKTLANNVTVNGNLNIGAGTTLQVANRDLNVSGLTTIIGTLADNNATGVTNLQNVDMQGGTIDHTVIDDVNILGSLTASSGSSTLANANIVVSGATLINAGATLVISGTSTKNFNNTVTNNGTWTTSGAPNVTIGGNLTNNGTMSQTGTGTYTFNTTSAIGGTQPITFQGPVTVSGNITLTNSNNAGVTFQGALTGTVAGSTFTNNATMYYAHNSLPMGARPFNANAAGNNVYYSLGGDQPVRNVTYANLFISGSGTKTAAGAFTVQGNLNIAAGTTLADGGNLITVNGNVTNYGSATGTGGIRITGGAPPHIITGNGYYQRLDINSNSTMSAAAASISVDNLVLSAGSLAIDNNTLTVNNTLNVAGGTLTTIAAQSNITFNGTAAINMPASVTALNNFTLNNTVGSSLSASLTVNGTLTLTNGALTYANPNILTIYSGPTVVNGYLTGGINTVLRTAGTSNITLPANLVQTGGTIDLDIQNTGGLTSNIPRADDVTIAASCTMALGSDIALTGNITNAGTYNGTGRITTFNRVGAGNQTLSGAGIFNFGSIVINTSNQLVLAQNINVYGDWDLNAGGFSGNFEVSFIGTSPQDIGGILSTTFYRLRTTNTLLTISNNQTVTNRLRFDGSGKITLGNSDLIIANPATISNNSNTRFVITNGVGRLVRSGAIGAGFVFPVGTSSASADYAPVTFVAAGSNNVGVRAIGNKHPDNPSSADYLNRYWAITTLAGGNLAAGNFTFTYSSGLVGSPQSAYYYGGTWTSSGGSAASPFTIALPALAAGDAIDVSGIDFVQPSVVSVTPSTTMVSDANIGANGFYLDIVYSESMDPAYTPVVSFPTAGENPAPTLSFSSGVWINATTFRAYYNVVDFNLVMTNIDVRVGDGRDLVGNIQNPNPHNALNLFSIDMFCVSANAGPDQRVCETVPGGLTANITMNASLPGAGTGTWSYSGPGMGAFSNINSNTTNVTNLQPGVHSFTWTITGGACPGSDIVVIYNDQPTPANAGVDQASVCNGTATLGANAPPIVGVGTWTGPFGVTFDNSTVYNTVARNLLSGVNVLTWTITNGACSSTDNVSITNNQVTVANAGADQVLCTNTTALDGNTPISGSGIWTVVSGGATIINNTQPNTVVTNLQRRDNILRWTITRGTCSSFDEVRISNYSVIANAGLDDYTCDGTYQLQGNNPVTQNITIPNLPATGTWSTVGPTIIADINLYNTGITNMDLDANTYKWTVTNGVCTSEDEVVISNDMPTLPSAGPDATFCGVDFAPSGYNSIYNSLTANAPNYARGEVGVWTQVAGSGTFLDANTTTNLRVDDLAQYAQLSGPDFWSLNPTVNTFRWTITYKLCELFDEVTITNAAPNLADAGPDQTVCFDEVNLNAEDHGSRAQTHVWTIQSPAQTVEIINDPNQWNTYVQFLQSATTTFRWTKTNVINGLTCVVWDETEVIKTNNTGRPNAGPPQIVCSTEADLAATSVADIGFPTTDDVIGSWAVLDGNAVFADVNSPSTHVTNLAYQRNVLRWTITNNTQGCIATADAYVTNALPSNANAGPDQFVCTNTALLSADRPTRGSGSWSVIGGSGTISNSTCQSFLCTAYVSGMGTGQNTFLWTMSNTYTDPASGETKTCILTDEIEVWNNAVTADAGLDLTVCVDNATLGATPPDPGKGETGFWVRTGGSATVVNPTLFNTTVTGLSPDGNTFRWTLSNAYCSSSDFMTITNNNPTDPVASTPNPNTCDGNATINGNNPLNGAGLWSVFAGGGTITNPSLTSTTVTGMPLGPNTYRWTITKQGCAESADVVVTNRAVVADAGADIDNICGIEPAISTVTLNAVEPNLALGQSGNWTVVTSAGSISTPTLYNTQINGMDNGTNTFRWTLTNGICSDNDEVSVFVYIPTTANAGADYETCADLADNRPLTGNTPAPGRGFGTWSLVSGSGNIAIPANAVTTVSNLGPDENVFRWTINHNGCLSQDQMTITNNFVTANAGPDDLICVDNYTLAANDPQTFNGGLAYPSGQWNTLQGTATYANPTLYNTTITNLSTAVTNIYRWTVTKGICSASDEVQIINNRFSISAGPDQTVCDDFAFLDAQQPGTGAGTWSLISGGGTFVNSTLYNTRVNGLSTNPNIFRWTVARNGCTAFDEVTVYNNKVTSNAGLPQRVCDNFATLDGNDPSLLLPAGATGNWVATIGGASISDPSLRNTLVTNLADGQNTFQWTISRTLNSVTCQSSSLVNIFNDTPSDAVVEADNEVCSNSTQLSVLNIPTIGSGIWTAVDNTATFDNPTSINVNVNGLNRGINTFRWTVTNLACSDFDDVVITNNVVSADAGLDKTTACADFTNLPGSVPLQGNGLWTDLSASGAIIVSPTLNTTLVTGLPQGNTDFRWTVTLGSCTSSDDVRITNNQITASAGADQVICNDFYSPLDGNNVSLIGGTGVWSSIGSTAIITNPTMFNTGVTGLDPGLNTFRWTVTSGSEGCTDFDEVGITNASVISNAGTDFETCNSTVTLGAQDPAPANGYWTQASGNPAVIVNSTSPTSQVTGLTGGIYAFTWTVSNGSCSSTSTVIITNSSPQLAVANTGAPEVCNSSGSLVGNALLVGEQGLWTIPSGSGIIANNTLNNTTVSNLGLGNNTFRWTITKGTNVNCTSQAEVNITNNTVSANAGPDQDICTNTANLAATAPTQGTGVWTKFGINPAVISDPTLRTSSVTGLADNTSHGFTWTVSLGSCSAADDVYINNNRVLADAGGDQATCNSSINLDGNDVSSYGATGNWTLVTPGPSQISNSSQYNTLVTDLGTGLNIFRWTVTSAKGCISSDDVGITYNFITANAGLPQETCNSSVTMAAGNPAPGTGTWSQVSGNPSTITDPTLATTTITGLTAGDYTFRWTVLYNGCTATSDVIVTNSSPQNALANTPSPEVCNNTGTLIGSALLPGERGLWTIPSGSGIIANNTLNNTTVSNLGLGNNTFRWTITKGTNVNCTSQAQVTITNNTVSANAGPDQDICTNTANLAATAPTQGTGVWTKFGINPAVITDATLRTSSVTGLADNTSHGFTWTVSLGSCTTSDDVYINNNRVLADAGSDQATCNSSINLDGNDVSSYGATGNWTLVTPGPAQISNASQYNTLVTSLGNGLNIFRWTVTSAQGCTSTDDVGITYNFISANAGLPQETCNSSVTMAAGNPAPGTGTWSQVSGNPSTITDPTLATTTITGLTAGDYTFRWTVLYNGCTATSDVIVTNSAPQTAIANTPSPEVCNNTGTLIGSALLPGERGLWTIPSGSGIIANNTLNNTTVSNLGLGNNTFRWTITKGTNVNCTSQAQVTITNNTVSANAGPDQDICTNTANLAATAPTQGTGVWTKFGINPAVISDPTLRTSSVTGLADNTSHGFTWTVSLGSCSASDDVYINNNRVLADAGGDQATCNSSINLDGNDVSSFGATGNWTLVTPGPAQISNASQYNTLVTSLGNGLNIFRWTVTSAQGCSSTDDVGITYNFISANAGLAQETCNSSVTMAAGNPAPGTGTWSQVSGNPSTITDPTLATTTITGLTAGDYTFRWTVLYNGCTATSDVIVTNSAPQTAIANTPSPEVCNNTGTLIGSALLPGERGLWTIPSGSGIIANNTLNNTTVSNLGLGNNTFRWTITKGTNVNCTSQAQVTITNNTVSANAGPDQDICTNTANLAATAPTQGIGVWTKFGINPAVITDPTLRTSSVTGLADNTSHGFTWTVSLGSCSAADDVYINNNRVLADAGGDQATCNSSINLDGNDVSSFGASGNWTLVTPGPSQISNPSQYNTLVTNLGSGLNIFRWTVTSAKGCISSDDVGITYNYITANAGLAQETCNTSVTLGAGDPSPGAGTWTQVSGNPATITDATLANTTITGLTSGNYTFRWTVVYSGCTATSDVIITNSAPQTALANTPSPEVCDGNGTLVGNAVLLGESGLWTLISGTGNIANPSSNNTSVSNLGPGNNLFRWTIRKGITTTCSSFANVTITNNQVSAFAFTPNNVSCDGNATLGANDPSPLSATGLWTVSTGAVISDPTSNSITATNLAAGNNIFTWTVTRGTCTANSSVTISNNQVVATVGGDINLCGSSTNLNAFDPTPNMGIWTLETGDNPAAIVIDNPGLFNTAVSGISKTAIFKWKVTGISCKDSAYVTVNNNSITVNNGASQTVCSSNANLIAGALAPGQTGQWTSAGVNPVIANPTSTTTAISNLDNGTNIFFWTITNVSGCSGSGRYDVINDSPSQPNAGPDQDLCLSSGALNANTPTYGTGEWKQVGGSPLTVIADPFAASTTVSNLGTGATTFVWLITNNSCSVGDSVILNNNLFTVATANDKSVCTDASTLGVVQGFPGTWTKISGSAIIANSTDPNTAVTNLSFGANTFLWTVNNGSCVVSDEMTITNNSPEVPITEVDKTVCQVNGVTISANTPTYGTGTWTNVGGGTATIVNPSNSNTTVNNLINGANTLRWTLAYNGCTRDDDLIITSYAAIALAGSDESLCGSSTSLNAIAPAYGTGSWSIISGSAIIANTLDPKSSVSNLSQGANIFRWTVNNVSCSSFDEVTITNNAPDIANAGSDLPICTYTVNLNGNNPTVGIGTWTTTTTSAIIDNPGLYNTSVTVPSGSTVFRWTIRNNGCESFDEVTVNNNSLMVNVNPDGVSCNGTFSLLGTNPALIGTGTGTGTWTVVGGSAIIVNPSAFNTTANSLLATGSRESVFRWTVVDGACSASKDVRVVNDQVTASNSGFMTCNSSVPILANDPGIQGATGLWTVENPQGQVIANPTSFSTSVSNLRPGTINRLNWTVTRNTCSAADTMNIEYFVPNANITIPDIPFSCTDTVQLIADANLGGGTGIWSLKFGSLQVTIDNPTNTTTIARNLEIGNNVFVWTVTNRGCTSYDEVSINNSKPINTAGSDQAACNNTFTMNAQIPTPTGSGLWSTISGTVSYGSMTSPTTTVTVGTGTNILQWTITDNGCSNSKQFNITNSLTTPNAGEDVSVCENRVRLSGSSLKPGESGVWTIDGGILAEVFSNASVHNPEVTNLRQGNTTFAWTVTNGICTGVDRVVVTNNTPLVDAGPDRVICENFVTLEGNNPAPGSSGLWTIGNTNVNITSPTAYNSTVTNLSKGSNLFTWTINNGICTASDNVLITSNSIDVVAGLPYTEACSDTLVLTGTQPPLNTNGFWTAVEGGGTFDNATSFSTIARNLTGYNKLRWTIVSGSCSYFNDLVFVSLLPTKANTETDKLVCATTTQINANAPGAGETGRWDNVIGTATFENRSNFQTTVYNLVQGVNVFKWTISNALCNTSDLLTVTNNQVFADAGQDKTMCDSNYTLSANLINGLGVWTANTLGVIIANSTSPNTNVSNLNYGPNSFSWTVTYNGCSATDEVILTSNLPRNVSAGSNQNICSGSTNLAGTNPGFDGTGLWTLTGGAGVFENPTSNQTVVSGLATGENIFRWTVTVGSCSASSQVRINNNSLYVTAGTDQVVCNTNQLLLNGTQPGPGITGTWSVNGGAGTFDNPSVFNTTVRNFTKGTNTFVWTLTDGSCTNSAQISVVNNTPDSALVGSDQLICTSTTTINAVAVSNGFGTWSLKSGSATIVSPSSNNTLITGINNGLNTFTWTVDKNGCKLSADVNVTNNSVNAFISNKEVTICTPSHTATIIGNPIKFGETGFWTKTSAGNGVITSSTTNVTTVTNLDYGSTFFRWTVSNGSCSSSDDVRVTDNYYNFTTASVAGSPNLCVDYADILGSMWPDGASGRWSSTAPDVTFDNVSAVSTVVRRLPQGTSAITWTITKDGCASPASFNLVNNAILTSAGIDRVICQTSTNLNALALLSGQTGVWTVDNGSVIIADLNSPTTLVTNLITGNNTFTWTVTSPSGCTAVDNVVISNNAFIVTAGMDNISCGPSYTLSGTDPLTGTGIWTVSSGTGAFVSASSYTTVVNGISNGPNTYTWTVTRNGCTASDDVVITNDSYPAVVGADRFVCTNSATVTAQPINPNSGASGLWSVQTGSGTFANPTSFSTAITGLSLGDNRLRWTVSKGACSSFDEIVISNKAITTSAGTDETTCDNFFTLNATPLNANEVGTWSSGGLGIQFVSPNSPSTLVNFLNQGLNTFAWFVRDTITNCTATSTVRVTSNFFKPYAGPDMDVTTSNYTMQASTYPPGSTGTWSLVSGAGNFVDPVSPTSIVNNLGFGKNTFRWTVTWNLCTYSDDVDINYSSVVADAGRDTFVCGPVYTLVGNDPAPYGTGVWTKISGSGVITNSANPVTTVTGIQMGTVNIYRWTVTVNQHSVYDDVMVVNREFNLSAGVDKVVCVDNVTLSADPPGVGTGSWQVLVGSGTFSDLTDPNATITNLGDGGNVFQWTVSKTNGCTKSDIVEIFYNVPPIANFEMDRTSGCSPITVEFTNTSSGGSYYYWNFGNDQRTDTILTVFNRTYEALYNADSTYTITLTAYDDAGCSSTISRSVTAFMIPLVDFEAFPAEQEYPGARVYFENYSGQGYGNYYWTLGDGNTRLDNSYVATFEHTYATWGTFEVTLVVSSVNCSDTARQTVRIFAPKPQNNGGRPHTGCEPFTVNFNSSTLYADRWYWEFGNLGTSTQENPTFIFDEPGQYIVKLWAWGPGGPNNGQDSVFMRNDTITVYPRPEVDFLFTPDSVMLPNQPVHFYNRSTYGDIFEWDFGIPGQQAISNDENPIFYYTQTGTYYVTLRVWSLPLMCFNTYTSTLGVVVEPAGVCKFPNAFSPNPSGSSGGVWIPGDVSNDVFYPIHRGVKEYKLEIFNRWGEKIFESNDPAIGWDGYIDGKLAAQDVYVWKVTGKFKNGVIFKDAGDVTLMR